jgi:signal transduction histidine kinase
VTLLGGEVAIKGEPGQGSEVRARIPLAAANAQEAAA